LLSGTWEEFAEQVGLNNEVEVEDWRSDDKSGEYDELACVECREGEEDIRTVHFIANFWSVIAINYLVQLLVRNTVSLAVLIIFLLVLSLYYCFWANKSEWMNENGKHQNINSAANPWRVISFTSVTAGARGLPDSLWPAAQQYDNTT